jgi:Sigma-70, region 4
MRTYNLGKGWKKVNKFTNLTTLKEKHCPRRFWPSLKPCPHFGRHTLGIGKAVEHLVASLPPKERACILLKDVFDYSLEEIAELVDSTVGGRQGSTAAGPN